jgi:hypothetical protein
MLAWWHDDQLGRHARQGAGLGIDGLRHAAWWLQWATRDRGAVRAIDRERDRTAGDARLAPPASIFVPGL